MTGPRSMTRVTLSPKDAWGSPASGGAAPARRPRGSAPFDPPRPVLRSDSVGADGSGRCVVGGGPRIGRPRIGLRGLRPRRRGFGRGRLEGGRFGRRGVGRGRFG